MKARAPAPTVPLDRGRIADRILDDLRERIARGELPRGTRIPAERELAQRYQVSGATIREALRGLGAMGYLDVRHGSGTYVTAAQESLVATSLGTLIQLEEVSLADILGILAVLHRHAAELALVNATDAEIAALAAANDALATAGNAAVLADGLTRFLRGLSTAAHNPLLAALCNFLAELQVRLALELSRQSHEQWRKMTGALHADRAALVAALKARDRAALIAAVDGYHAAAIALIERLPYGRRKRIPSPALSGALAAIREARKAHKVQA